MKDTQMKWQQSFLWLEEGSGEVRFDEIAFPHIVAIWLEASFQDTCIFQLAKVFHS